MAYLIITFWPAMLCAVIKGCLIGWLSAKD